jgi:pyrroloquinoline quinone biosynthesis protein B
VGAEDDDTGHKNQLPVRARLLGTAAGGGLPQWNCACAMCARARRDGAGRTQDCLAVTGAGRRWHLVNVSPDIRAQILAAPELAAGPERRQTPVSGVLLTDGELDHTVGLLMLRECSPLDVYGPEPVLDALRGCFPVRPILDLYGSLTWREVRPGETIPLDEQLSVTAVPLSVKRPRYVQSATSRPPLGHPWPPQRASPEASGARAAGPWVVAYRFEDCLTGGSLVYAPCFAAWTGSLDTALAGARGLILDGTFFHDDEMLHATGQDRPARAMGHLPIAESVQRLRGHPAARKLYTHLNNTNPALAEDSPERATLEAAGLEVAYDGLVLDL